MNGVGRWVKNDSDFEDDEFVPDEEQKEIFKAFKEKLEETGKPFSESKSDFHGKYFTRKIKDENE